MARRYKLTQKDGRPLLRVGETRERRATKRPEFSTYHKITTALC